MDEQKTEQEAESVQTAQKPVKRRRPWWARLLKVVGWVCVALVVLALLLPTLLSLGVTRGVALNAVNGAIAPAKLEIEAKPLGETVDETPIDGDASRRLLHFLNVCPFGVQRYSPAVKSDVETSLTCAIAQSSPREVGFVVSVRSSVSSQLDWTYSRLRCLADLCGMRISPRKAEFPRFGRFIG